MCQDRTVGLLAEVYYKRFVDRQLSILSINQEANQLATLLLRKRFAIKLFIPRRQERVGDVESLPIQR